MIVDAEVHLIPPDVFRYAKGSEPTYKHIFQHIDYPLVQDKLSVEYLLESMGRCGIDRALIMGLPWCDKGLQRENNELIRECVKTWPDKFRGFVIPTLGKPVDTTGFIGAKLIPLWQGAAADSLSLYPLYEQLISENKYLMIHTGLPHDRWDPPHKLLRVVQDLPELKVLAPHLGGLLCLLAQYKEAFHNVHFITSVSATMYLVEFAHRVFPDKLIFGTDFPFNHCHDQETPLKALRDLNLLNEAEILSGVWA